MTINLASIITFNSFHSITVDDALIFIFFVALVFVLFSADSHRLSQGTKAQSNLSRIMSADCNRRIDRHTATLFSARCVAVDAKHIFPVYAAADHI